MQETERTVDTLAETSGKEAVILGGTAEDEKEGEEEEEEQEDNTEINGEWENEISGEWEKVRGREAGMQIRKREDGTDEGDETGKEEEGGRK